MDSPRYTVGIDPGIGGGVVLLDSNDGTVLRSIRTPVFTEKNKRHYDLPGMRAALILRNHTLDLVAIEKVHTLPRDGRVGAFNFGVGYGMWLGLLSGLTLPYTEVTPQRWQARMLAGLPRGPQVKASAVRAAKSLFPKLPLNFKADWGMADAALIAEYGRRLKQGVTT
jgi:hypothetical protein